MAQSGIARAYVVTSAEKSDVRERLGSGGGGSPELDHLVLESSPASAYTVSIGTTAAGERLVALGFPDVLWQGDRAFRRLAEALDEEGAQVALGTFPRAPDYPTDGVQLDPSGRVLGFEPAHVADGLPTWTLAVWTPPFSRLLEGEVAHRYGPWTGEAAQGELSMSQAFALALQAGLSMVSVRISDEPFLDIGDPGRLEAARAAAGLS
jgi:glucose-1-phosphate thymidylyltransferase